jgi:nucleoside-diphosphate-sugar epimerase
MRILVTGATGTIGGQLVRVLAAGHSVRVATFSPKGLFGRAYRSLLLPVHALFSALVNAISMEAEEWR